MKPKGPTVRAVLYCRVSKEQARTSGVTLEAQESRLRAYCLSLGLEVAAVVKDDGVSGAVPFADRPAGAQVRELFLAGACNLAKGQRRGAPSHLVAAKLDRFGRDTADLLSTVREYQGAGILVHTSDEGGLVESLENDDAELLLTIRAAFASHERRKISTRTKAALAFKKSQGLRTGHVPYGKRLADDGKLLADNPAELEAVELMRAAKEARLRLGAELAEVRSKIAGLEWIRREWRLEVEPLQAALRENRAEYDEQDNNATEADLESALVLRERLAALKKQLRPKQAEMRRLLRQELALGRAYRDNGSRALARTLSANPSRYPARGAKGWSAQLVEQVLARI
jgi:DNA invertase Pin-like site-specific DNA recombinase